LRLGRTCGRIIKALYLRDGHATLSELAEILAARPRDVRRRYIARLEERLIVEVDGDVVVLVEDWSDNLYIERGRMGELEAEERVRENNCRARKAHRDFLAGNNKPQENPPMNNDKHSGECSCEACAEERGRPEREARSVHVLRPEHLEPLDPEPGSSPWPEAPRVSGTAPHERMDDVGLEKVRDAMTFNGPRGALRNYRQNPTDATFTFVVNAVMVIRGYGSGRWKELRPTYAPLVASVVEELEGTENPEDERRAQ
jgi:hypothetical protein